jgi:PAS domain S-box-containing protein
MQISKYTSRIRTYRRNSLQNNNEICFQQVFLYSPVVWLLVDPKTNDIIAANAAANKFYGYSTEELKTMRTIEIPISPIKKVKTDRIQLDNSIQAPKFCQHKLKNGHVKDVAVYSGPFKTGGRILISLIVIDITVRRKAEKRFQTFYEMKRRADVLNDILNGIRGEDEETLTYIKNIGLTFSQPLFCCVIQLEKSVDCRYHHKSGSVTIKEDTKYELIDKLNDTNGCITWERRNNIGVLYQLRPSDQKNNFTGEILAQFLQKKIHKYHPDIPIRIGIGENQQGIRGFTKSFQQALEALHASQYDPESGKDIIHFRDLGILQLLINPSENERTNEFIKKTIGKLIRYDHERGTNYLDTLAVILQKSNLKETAKLLFLHYNTVIFRKQRIEQILGISINEFETKLTLATAIKLYKLNLTK